jgi:hypothetical protein
MPEIMAGQTRSVSLPRRILNTRSAVMDARQMAETHSTEHLIRVVTETSVVQYPWAMADEKLLIKAKGVIRRPTRNNNTLSQWKRNS